MGNSLSRKFSKHNPNPYESMSTIQPKTTIKFERIPDTFNTIEEVVAALRKAGLESSQLIVGVDFTKSNTWTGQRSFEGRSLHDINGPPNPYIIALSLIARTLESFDDDHYIFGYGFGDTSTRADFVFSLLPNNQPIHGLDELLKTYRRMVPHVHLSGPTSFAPLIRQTMRHVYDTGMQFHILLIVADGQIHPSCLDDTKRAIVDASYFPISIVMVGVGDGPWNDMRKFDDQLPSRKWDNFQFVELQKIMEHPSMSAERREASFALNALMEVPHQYKIVQYLTGTNQRENVASIVEAIPPNLVLNPPVNTITSDMTLSFI